MWRKTVETWADCRFATYSPTFKSFKSSPFATMAFNSSTAVYNATVVSFQATEKCRPDGESSVRARFFELRAILLSGDDNFNQENLHSVQLSVKLVKHSVQQNL